MASREKSKRTYQRLVYTTGVLMSVNAMTDCSASCGQDTFRHVLSHHNMQDSVVACNNSFIEVNVSGHLSYFLEVSEKNHHSFPFINLSFLEIFRCIDSSLFLNFFYQTLWDKFIQWYTALTSVMILCSSLIEEPS
jgi:hypothetical protein